MTANVLLGDTMGNSKPGCLAMIVFQLSIATFVIAFALVFAAIAKWLLPWTIPVNLFFVWKLQGTWSDWAWAMLPVLFVGLLTNILSDLWKEISKSLGSHFRRFLRFMNAATPEEQLALRATPWHEEEETEEKEKPTEAENPDNENGEKKKKTRIARMDPTFLLVQGLFISTFAGIFEELLFRWLILIGLMPIVLGLNFVTCGLVRTLHEFVFGPLANFLTLGYIEEYIHFAGGWQFGFAMLCSGMMFKSGHNYQSWLGRTSAWFFGMYMFGITMAYGLPIAIATHFLNNMLVALYSGSRASTEQMRQVAKNMAEKKEIEQALEAAEKNAADSSDQPTPGLIEEGPPPVSSLDPKDWT